jgi:hypothetical protein
MSEPETKPQKTRLAARLAIAILFAVLLGVFAYFAKEKADRHNSGMGQNGYEAIFDHDQHPYLGVARKLRETNFDWIVPRHRMPGYSLLMAPLFDPETAHPIDPTGKDERRVGEAYFGRAKVFNIILCGIGLVAFYFFCRRWMPVMESLIATWSFGFLLEIFKAPYVQPEGVFYVTFTIAFVLLLRQITHPTWFNGLLAAVVLAITFILKSTVLPLIALFGACYGLKWLADAIGAWRRGEAAKHWRATPRLFGQAVIVPLVFIALLWPYLNTTRELFGSLFWDVHSRYYMWMDTPEEKVKWRDLEISEPHFHQNQRPEGEGELPSAAKYFREHTFEQIVQRPIDGFGKLMPRIELDYGPLVLFLWEFCRWSVLAVALLHWREVWAALRAHWPAVLCVLGFFIGYALLYSWYVAIRVGPRLILALAPPLIFLALWFVGKFAGEVRIPRLGVKINDRRIIGAALAVATAVLTGRVLREDLWHIEGGQ